MRGRDFYLQLLTRRMGQRTRVGKAWIRSDTRKLLNTTGQESVLRVFSRDMDLLEITRDGIDRRLGAIMKSREAARSAVALTVSDILDVSVDASFLSNVSAMSLCHGWFGQHLQLRRLRAGHHKPWSSETERHRSLRRRRLRMSDREVVRLACQSDCVRDHRPRV